MICKDFIAPIKGKLLSIECVEDEIFSDRVMGDGFAIEINGREIVAPFDGEIGATFPSGHAVCVIGDNGIQVMIHIGLETHKLPGQIHKLQVQKGDRVKAGDLLVISDYKKIRKNKAHSLCPIVFLNDERVELLKENQDVDVREEDIISIEI